MSNMMIGMVPVNGPLSSGDLFCQQNESMRCYHGQFGLGCAKMHRVRQSARARCWSDAQGWLCPRLQLCTLNHVHEVNVSRLPWVYTLVPKPERLDRGRNGNGEGFGLGISAQAVLVLHPRQRGLKVGRVRASLAAGQIKYSQASRQAFSSFGTL